MNALSLPLEYLFWHYSRALLDMFGIMRNYAWAIGHVFSVRIILSTLFVPWHRMHEHSAGLFSDPAEFFGNLLVNTTLRIIGFIVRTGILLIALLAWVALVLVGVLVLLSWVMLPVVLVMLTISAITSLFI